ncbi:MAG: B12-binding domain-containing radical SAM protein [Spirochaetia bacterium]|nr:B12-binding domain-containing radical SAM protein [Spirochaetia bacterium]
MKLLLIQPPIQDFYETKIRLQPIGLCYLKSSVKKYLPEIEVKIIDFHSDWGKRTIQWPSELNYLKEYHIQDESPFCGFSNYFHFGADWNEIENIIKQEKADIAGISSLFSPYYREALQTAGIAKKLGLITILGGSHVSAMPLFTLNKPEVDFIIQKEGEKPLVELLKEILSSKNFENVPNLGYKKNSKPYLTKIEENYSINELPVPDLTDFELRKYKLEKQPMTFIITSRGCPYSCSFCSVRTTFGRLYRKRNNSLILKEIEKRYDDGYRVFDFEDDNLTFHKGEMSILFDSIKKQFTDNNKPIKLTAMNGLSYLSLDEDILLKMKEAGFSELNLALVSSDKNLHETTKRPHKIEKYLNVIETAYKLKFNIVSYQILGFPEESLDSQMQTLAFNANLPVLLGASPFYLTPYSPIALKMNRNFSEDDIFLSRLTSFAAQSKSFTQKDIYTLFICTRIFNFIKSFSLSKDIDIKTLIQKTKAEGRIKLGLHLLEKIFDTHKLFCYSQKKIIEHPNFNSEIFKEIINKTKFIKTLSGRNIIF